MIGGHFTNDHDPGRARQIAEHCQFSSVTLFGSAVNMASTLRQALPKCLIILRPVWTEGPGMPSQTHGDGGDMSYFLGRSDAEKVVEASGNLVSDGQFLLQYKNEVAPVSPDAVANYYMGYMSKLDEWNFKGTILDSPVGHYGSEYVDDPTFQTMLRNASEKGHWLNYHGYSDPTTQKMSQFPAWYALRMGMLKARADELGVPFPKVVHGEAGPYYPWRSDLGIRQTPVREITPQELADDIAQFAKMTPTWLTHWNLYNFLDVAGWPGFEMSDQQVILDTIRRVNLGGVQQVDQITLRLKDMWVRQGVDIHEDDPVFQYCVTRARVDNKVILPQYTVSGSWQNWSDEKYVICYTIPTPLWFEKGVWQINEGFPTTW